MSFGKYFPKLLTKKIRTFDKNFERLHKKFEIPRMYVKVKKEMQMKEVMLGPKISPEKTDEIVAWLYATGKVEKVTKSKRHMK